MIRSGARQSARRASRLLLLSVLLLAGCSPTYSALRSESGFPDLAALKASAASLPSRTLRVPVAVNARTVTLALRETGRPADESRVVILLHGLFSDSRVWRFVAGDLGTDHRLLTVDLPGCGRSDKPAPESLGPAGYAPTALTRTVLLALRAYLRDRPDITRLTLVGHSLGGAIALICFADESLRQEFADVVDRVDALVLLAPADLTADYDAAEAEGAGSEREPDENVFDALARLSGTDVFLADVTGRLHEGMAQAARRGVADPTRALREEADRGVQILRDGPRRRALQAMIVQAAQQDPPSLAALRRGYANVTVPVLVVSGDGDDVVPPNLTRSLADALPNARYELLDHAKHSLPTERPRDVSRLIRLGVTVPRATRNDEGAVLSGRRRGCRRRGPVAGAAAPAPPPDRSVAARLRRIRSGCAAR